MPAQALVRGAVIPGRHSDFIQNSGSGVPDTVRWTDVTTSNSGTIAYSSSALHWSCGTVTGSDYGTIWCTQKNQPARNIGVLAQFASGAVGRISGFRLCARATSTTLAASGTPQDSVYVRLNASAIDVYKIVAGTATSLATASITWSNNTVYWVRFEAIGTTLRAKFWTDGTAEPQDWTVSGSDTALYAGAGMAAVTLTSNTTLACVADLYQHILYVPGMSPLSQLPQMPGAGPMNVDLTQTVSGAGGIASGEAFGTPVVTRVGTDIALTSGIASEEAFGTPNVSYQQFLTGISGIATAEAFGTPTIEVPSTRDLVMAAIKGSTTQVLRKVDIYEEDATTPYVLDADFVDYSVSVDGGRAERRSLDSLTLYADDDSLRAYPGNFWYDKVIKVYRGVLLEDSGSEFYEQVGEFVIDTIDQDHFPSTLTKVAGRDYTARLESSEFVAPTAFTEGQDLESVIHIIATNGGIDKFNLPTTGKELGKDFYFDVGTTRWDAINQLAGAYGFEVFFDAYGYLSMREYLDPVTSPVVMRYETGAVGTIAGFQKKTSGARLYNHIVCSGDSSDPNVPPVWAEAINTDPSSPTNVDEIGDRVYRYTSPFFTTTQQCQDTADALLRVKALEEFEVDIDALIIPWLEANTIIEFIDPDPNPGDPVRFLLTGFPIGSDLGTHSLTAKRVTIVE